MDIRLSPLIVWPKCEDLQETIDLNKPCLQIAIYAVFIGRPVNLRARPQTF